jgi:hypothetical protein
MEIGSHGFESTFNYEPDVAQYYVITHASTNSLSAHLPEFKYRHGDEL